MSDQSILEAGGAMHFRGWMIAIATIVLASSSQLHAGYIVNTGSPPASAGGLTLSSTAQDVAAQFSITDSYVLNSVEGFLDKYSATGELIIAIHSDSGGLPGATLYSTTITPSQVFFTGSWQGAFGLNWALAVGTYWASFEVSDASFTGYMPAPAPSPLPGAYRPSDGIWRSYPARIGVRIDASEGTSLSATPEPASVLLLGMGGALMFAGRQLRRRTAGLTC